ncbi:MAG: trypsin-like peptidase domain-containing protein [Planctomycetaceae bacterium]|nr:trypsin-like peptidase domain-containing protein [Planctomycetaceae bacterium]
MSEPNYQYEPEVPPPARRKKLPLLLFALLFLAGLLAIPHLAEEIVFRTTRGAERAKAEIARQLLNDPKLAGPEQRIAWVAKAVAPSVVGIQTLTPAGRGVGMEVGSGVIVAPQGFILTNFHVVANAKKIQIQLNDGRIVQTVLVGKDPMTDLAVLKTEEPKLEAAKWGDSRDISVGDQVVAIGNPYNLGQTVTSGIISATERYNPMPSRTMVQEFLQTDAAINPGNSGGALVNLKGELIGINTMIYSETGGNLGIGFAIPSILAKKVYEEIIKHGEMRHGWLGIAMNPASPRTVEPKTPNGVAVAGFFPVSPARDGGMEIGDIVLRWGKNDIDNPLQLSHLIVLTPPGTTETVEVLRGKEVVKVQITLGTRPVEIQ